MSAFSEAAVPRPNVNELDMVAKPFGLPCTPLCAFLERDRMAREESAEHYRQTDRGVTTR